MIKLVFLNYLVFLLCLGCINCLQYELSVVIEAGRTECFHQFLRGNLNMETDYQVIHGGDLDVTYFITSPQNKIIYSEVRKNGGQSQFRTDFDGEYKFCFDNSFSRFADKQVFFYLASIDPFDDPLFEQKRMFDSNKDQLAKDDLGELENKIATFKEAFVRVTGNLERAQHIQNIFKAYEMIDRSLMEKSYERVNFWSVLNIVVMVAVGFLQVFMIRSLFEDRSAIGKVLRK